MVKVVVAVGRLVKYRIPPTWPQKIMLALMVIAYAALLGWAWVEIVGVVSSSPEDTWSELIWDLPAWLFWVAVVLHLVPGILFIWASGHFVEGYMSRRRRERQSSS